MEPGFAISLGLVAAIAVLASRRGRSPITWGVLAVLASIVSSASLVMLASSMSGSEHAGLFFAMISPLASIVAPIGVGAIVLVIPAKPPPTFAGSSRLPSRQTPFRRASKTEDDGSPGLDASGAIQDGARVQLLANALSVERPGMPRELVAYRPPARSRGKTEPGRRQPRQDVFTGRRGEWEGFLWIGTP
ncbi:MAG: hypothetical protein WCJ30_07170, partial [Deltaproteobacteria bacterium]